MKLYIAGPMRGIRLYNFPLFFRCALELRRMGHDVINPAEIDMAAGFDPHLSLDAPDQIKFDIEQTLRKDFKKILDDREGIVMLPGAEHSSGASAERLIAQMTGLDVFHYHPEARFEGCLELVEQCDIEIIFTETGAC